MKYSNHSFMGIFDLKLLKSSIKPLEKNQLKKVHKMDQQCKQVIECSSSMPMAWVPSPTSQKRKIKICKIFLDLAFCFPIKEMEGSWWIVVSTSEFSQQEKASYPSGGVESIGQTMLSPVHWAEVAGKETNLCLSRGDLAIA